MESAFFSVIQVIASFYPAWADVSPADCCIARWAARNTRGRLVSEFVASRVWVAVDCLSTPLAAESTRGKLGSSHLYH